MLKLQRLELAGFKSFVEPAELDFSGATTAIVGPNGCGKSNLSDAVTWVLGERSAKNLRGQTMEDVIFNGSRGRKPLGMAEASLTLQTDPDFPHAENGRLVIGRRVYRSGEGEYFLNGRKVRLKDVRDLLMDTGLGIRTYSVIEQGQIGMILSGKPQERRRLLEEAAGITRYKERKRIAEIKLEEAMGNLHRLDDIISELERALRSLKRQAGAARRFAERREAHRDLLRRVLVGRWARLASELDGVAQSMRATQDREAALNAGIHGAEAELAAGRERLEAVAEALAARHDEQARLAARIEGRQQFLTGSRDRSQELAERISNGEALATQRAAEVEQRRAAIAELEATEQRLTEECRQAADHVDSDSDQLSAAEESVRAAESELETRRSELLASTGHLNELRNQQHREQLEREKGEYRVQRLIQELESRSAKLDSAKAEAASAESRWRTLKEQCERQGAELEQAAKELESQTTQRASEEQRGTALRQELARMEQRQQMLRELSEAHAERREQLEAALAAEGLLSPAFLDRQVRAPEGWEQALDDYLDRLAEAIVLPGDWDGLELVTALSNRTGSLALLRPLDEDEPRRPVIQDEAIVDSLASALGLPEPVASALPPAYLVREPADAQRLARAHPGVTFLSQDRVMARGGLLQLRTGAARPGVLSRESQLAELETAVPKQRNVLQELESRLAELRARETDLQEKRRQAEEALTKAQQERAVAEARHADSSAQLRRLQVEHDTLTTERAEIERELARLGETSVRVADERDEAEGRHQRLEAAFDDLQQQVERAKESRAQLRAEGASRRGHLQLVEERLESHRRNLQRVREEISAGREQVEAWKQEAERLRERRTELQKEIESAELDLQQALEESEDAAGAVAAEQERLDEQRKAVRELEASLAELRTQRDAVRDELGTTRVREAELKQDAEHLGSTFREHFQTALPEDPGEVPADLAELEADLERLKERLDKMGPVNLLAAEEFEEQDQRHEFLTTQRADVARSVESLQTTIREINQTSSERFRKTFDEVNESFGRTFTDLFEGGEAEMRLMDEDDLLESGIEIMARPPGKRPQNIMLLSGGEKALTAIALLFALFRTKPSPFCILDEVDAPLDDVNTLRFVEMLKRMAGETQFVVITHNKLTMEAASRLYGVTMQERGVSNLVSVELDQIQPPTNVAKGERAGEAASA